VDADEVLAATKQAVDAASQLAPSDSTGSIRLDQAASRGPLADAHRITRLKTGDKRATQVSCASTPVFRSHARAPVLRVFQTVRNSEELVDASV
jgi:hypothetical protein